MSNKIKLGSNDRIFHIINNTFLSIVLIIIILPLMNVVSQSFSNPTSVINGKVFFIPVKPTIIGYKSILTNSNLLSGFINSFFYTFFGTLISVSLTICAAYPLSRKTLIGKGAILWIFTFTMLFNGGLIPTYLLVNNLKMIDTRWVLLIPNAVGVWNVIIARTFFMNTLPNELFEAAEIDGSSDMRIFLRIVLPLSKPIIAVMVLFYSIWIWNSYFEALIYLNSSEKYPLQLILRNILISSKVQTSLIKAGGEDKTAQFALTEVLKYAIIVVASIPVLILYPFIQKYFSKGIMIGSLKG